MSRAPGSPGDAAASAAEAALAFADAAALGSWLAVHGRERRELWVRIFKVGSGTPSVDWGGCVVEAVRHGWIDGQRRALDEASFLQRLTPRRAGSTWSARNVGHATKLIVEGRMTPEGLAQVEAARADGRWEAAYAGQAGMEMPPDFLSALEGRPAAKAFFGTLDRQALYPIYHRLATARTSETRARRMERLLDQLDRGGPIR